MSAAAKILIRDYDPSWPDQFASLDRYYDVKDPLFDIIMDGAETWAAVTGWHVPDGDGQ